ncbi:hypothetical protein [Limosilactobacillus mucosae]|uniref:hypothetical protein n=1 Tax=Limosilactobacillus mucosae TaxID=97478 RepID=UPI0039960C44
MLSETKGILKKASFTLMAIAIYLLGSQIPVPAVKLTRHYQQLMHESSVSTLAVMSGANLPKLSLFSIGFTPFMVAMMAIQLVLLAKLPYLRELSQRQILLLQNLLTMLIAVFEAHLLVGNARLIDGPLAKITAIAALTAGAMLVTWLGNLNGSRGIGGMVVLIICNMMRSVAVQAGKLFHQLAVNWQGWLLIIGIVLLSLGLIWFLAAFRLARYEDAQIRSYLPSYTPPLMYPIGLNLGVMMTFMIGTALAVLPALIGARLGHRTLLLNSQFQISFAASLTFLLTYFFAWLQFNPKQQAKQMLYTNSYLLNVQPGKPTQRYLRRRLVSLTFFGALLAMGVIVMSLSGSLIKNEWGSILQLMAQLIMLVMFMNGLIDKLDELRIPRRYAKLKGDLENEVFRAGLAKRA